MKTEKRKLKELVRNEDNPRTHGTTQIEEFKKSVDKYGVIRPIVVDENNVILAGHGLYETLEQMGTEEVDVLVLKGLSEKDKKKLLLADNKIFQLGIDDQNKVEELLYSLEGDFEIPGYDAEILEELYGIKSIEPQSEDSPVVQARPQHYDFTALDEKEPPKTVANMRQEEEAKASVGRYVVCPHCGEKISI